MRDCGKVIQMRYPVTTKTGELADRL